CRFERRDVSLCKLDALRAIIFLGDAESFGELGPRRRRAALLFMAERDVEERAASWVEALAFFELATPLCHFPLIDEGAAFFEELCGERLVGGCGLAERFFGNEKGGGDDVE